MKSLDINLEGASTVNNPTCVYETAEFLNTLSNIRLNEDNSNSDEVAQAIGDFLNKLDDVTLETIGYYLNEVKAHSFARGLERYGKNATKIN